MKLPLLTLLAVLVPASLSAWTDAVEMRIARKGAQLAPPDLRMVIEKYASYYERGLASAARSEEAEPHVEYGSRGRLRQLLSREIDESAAMLRNRQPIPLFVERLGRIAHLVADANNPFQTTNSDARLGSCRADFESYLERRINAIPTVFYGLDLRSDVRRVVDEAVARSAGFYPLLGEEYFRYGERRSSADFDDRSTAFGIASVSYSHSVTDLVNVYYYVWKKAGGDVRSAPAMKSGNLILDETTIGAFRDPSAKRANEE